MDEFYCILQDIKENWKSYIKRPSLELLKSFMAGYSFCEYNENVDNGSNCFYGFDEYIRKKYQINPYICSSQDALGIIAFISASDYEAFYKFFEEFEEFSKLTKEEIQNIVDELDFKKLFEELNEDI